MWPLQLNRHIIIEFLFCRPTDCFTLTNQMLNRCTKTAQIQTWWLRIWKLVKNIHSKFKQSIHTEVRSLSLHICIRTEVRQCRPRCLLRYPCNLSIFIYYSHISIQYAILYVAGFSCRFSKHNTSSLSKSCHVSVLCLVNQHVLIIN